MELVYTPDCLLHDTGSHPECIERLDAFNNCANSVELNGETFLELVHSKEYIEKVKHHSAESRPLDGDTLTSTHSYRAACAAVGASLTAAISGGFALVRPPGHHAYAQRASGFCLFNNIAIATRYLTNQGKRVCILDIDGHLGDGTSSIFYQDSNVLFCSLHQYPAFPGTGWVDEIGSGPGKGYTINIPLPAGSGDDIFWKGLDYALPITRTFEPDIVAVSAGFDAHQADPLLQLGLSLDCYYQCGSWLKNNFKEVFAVLEGGYNLDVLPKAILQFVDGFNNKQQRNSEGTTTSNQGAISTFDRNIEQLHHILKSYWPV